MTGTLIRRDPAALTLLKILPFAVAHGYTLTGRTAAVPLFLSVGVTWALIAAHWGFSRAHERCGEFAMGLPVPARRLWALRTGLLAGTSLLLIAGVAAVAQASLFVNLGACVLLAVVWIQSWAPRKHVQSGLGWWAWSKAGVAGAIWLSVWLARQSAWLAVAPLGAAVVLGIRTYMAVPAGFEMSSSAGVRPAEGRPYVVGWLLLPRLLYEWYWWGMFVLFFVVGTLPASEEAGPVLVLALAISLAPVAIKLPQVAHLPISRRRLFAWATLPPLLSLLGGLLAGRVIHGPQGLRSWLIVYEPGGPETLRFVQLRADSGVMAVLAVLGGLIWLVMVMMQLMRQGVPAVTRRGLWMRRLRWGGLVAVCLLAVPLMAVLLTDELDLPGKPPATLAYYLALAIARVGGVFAPVWVAVPVVLGALAGIYLWAERRFERAEALCARSGLR